jgi:hypothetical protein
VNSKVPRKMIVEAINSTEDFVNVLIRVKLG